MNTNHIAILLEVESCRSISKAAQNLYMSQPQVSNIIRNLEEENGFPIFVRTRSGVAGEAFSGVSARYPDRDGKDQQDP